VSAVREGRGIFANLKTVVYFLLSCNISEVLVMFLGFLVFGALGHPLLAVQLLWVNLVTDGLPALALGMDPPASNVMLGARPEPGHPQRAPAAAAAAPRQRAHRGRPRALVIGHYALGWEWTVVRTAIFVTVVLAQLAHAFSTRSRFTGRWREGRAAIACSSWRCWARCCCRRAVVYAPVARRSSTPSPCRRRPGEW